jgi:streptomycin 3"-adenylyltransferase
VVIDRPANSEQYSALITALLDISGRYPPAFGARRPLELTVFSRDRLAPFQHPILAEFTYGEWLRRAFEMGGAPQPEVNPDWTLVLCQVRQQGHALIGPEPASILPSISGVDIRRAIHESLAPLLRGLQGDERNVILTLARMWFTLTTGEFTSKDAAARWSAERAPKEVAQTLELALGDQQEDWIRRSAEAARAAEYLGRQIGQSE